MIRATIYFEHQTPIDSVIDILSIKNEMHVLRIIELSRLSFTLNRNILNEIVVIATYNAIHVSISIVSMICPFQKLGLIL